MIAPPCAEFVADPSRPFAIVSTAGAPRREPVCRCGWAQGAHTEETRAVLRGEHPESVPDGSGDFFRRPKWTSPSGSCS